MSEREEKKEGAKQRISRGPRHGKVGMMSESAGRNGAVRKRCKRVERMVQGQGD